MSNYNQELHSSIVNILSNQEFDLTQKKAELQALMFTSYYANGAQISAHDILQRSEHQLKSKRAIHDEAVKNKAEVENVLDIADECNNKSKESTANASIIAANIEVATKAIVQLASDVGAIFDVIDAADFGTEIYDLAKDTKNLIDKTAFNAERVSQYALEAAAETAQVPASSIAATANKAHTTIAEIENETSREFESAVSQFSNDKSAFNQSVASRKEAEGKLTSYDVIWNALKVGYSKINESLNLELKVTQDQNVATQFNVSFRAFESPFPIDNSFKSDRKGTLEAPKLPAGYPVENYYILVVKNHKKSTFTIDLASECLKNAERFVKISANEWDSKTKYFEKNLNTHSILDVDGDEISLGQEYVVFILAEFLKGYQNLLNNFNNYLTAPSDVFILKNKLQSPLPSAINYQVNTRTVSFKLSQNKAFKVQYRCMFFPVNSSHTPPFYFNLTLAEHVSPSNYSIATIKVSGEENEQIDVQAEVKIEAETTDNFGNRLVPGKKYVPVILSASIEDEVYLNQFINSLSDFTRTKAFTFQGLDT